MHTVTIALDFASPDEAREAARAFTAMVRDGYEAEDVFDFSNAVQCAKNVEVKE